MSLLTIYFALIFLPGIIWAAIDAEYVNPKRPTQTQLLIRSFLFGTTTHAILFILYRALGFEFSLGTISSSTQDIEIEYIADEIALSIPLALALSIAWMYIQNYRLLTRALRYIKATKSFGDRDVWSYTFNSGLPFSEYVHVRDWERGIVYAGWVDVFSETDVQRELLLERVEAYNEDGEHVATIPRLYLSLAKDNITVEFPFGNKEGQNEPET